ncbi:DUF803-domain-containing protein [Coprinopsis marcescibilis]|uniref:DUF803-domain-containing protein n=1 Tax=Coprinopsis marcescibilis TaxID=230819 RepID=A0A5C3LIU5_COPMA|nr:DUF803-domain-containing protein [Coprinopsis marcescibilis]
MVEDKYIGLALSVSGSIAIGSSFIITKKGLNEAGSQTAHGQHASDNLAYFKSPMWWAGMITMVIGELANFAAYTFAPPILVTPLGALTVIVGAVLASFLLNEQLGPLGRIGCALCLLGSLIIVLHAPEDRPVETVDDILNYALQPGFLLYCFIVLVVCIVTIFIIAPKHGRTSPIPYLTVCSLVGSVSVMAIKAFGIAVKLTASGNNQFKHPSTYFFGIAVPLCILIQMNYFNKALDLFSTNVVNPIYYVGFSTATLVASLILFQGLYNTDTSTGVSLLTGFAVTFLGVHILNLSRAPEPEHPHHSALEGGLMNPRLSLQGRPSLDGWTDANPTGARSGHGRRGSLYRSQGQALFNAFDEHELVNPRAANGDVVGLRRLREEDEEEDSDDDVALDYDERSHLRGTTGKQQQPTPPQISRNNSGSRSPHNPSLTDVRIPGR